MFRIKQALAIGEAIFNTHAGAARALKDYPAPFSFAIAALTVANGLMQVANIRSQQPPAMFGGARQAGSPFLVGEQGPELVRLPTGSRVFSNNQTRGMMGGGNTNNITINVQGGLGSDAEMRNRAQRLGRMVNLEINRTTSSRTSRV